MVEPNGLNTGTAGITQGAWELIGGRSKALRACAREHGYLVGYGGMLATEDPSEGDMSRQGVPQPNHGGRYAPVYTGWFRPRAEARSPDGV